MRSIRTIFCMVAVASLTGCAALSLPRQRALQMQELSRIRQVAIACHMYACDNGDVLPSEPSQLAAYLHDSASVDNVLLVATGRLSDYTDEHDAVLVRSKIVFSDDMHAVAFVDGHCELLPAQ